MSVVNLEHDTRIKTNLSITEFAQHLQSQDISQLDDAERKLAVMRQITKIAAGEAIDHLQQRRLIADYLEASTEHARRTK